jgi:hypothetical protein
MVETCEKYLAKCGNFQLIEFSECQFILLGYRYFQTSTCRTELPYRQTIKPQSNGGLEIVGSLPAAGRFIVGSW